MYRSISLATALVATLAFASTASADGWSSFGRSFVASHQGGGVLSQGVGLARRAGGPASGAIALAGLPAHAVVERAFLYWVTIGGADPVIDFDGEALTGAVIGEASVTCWSFEEGNFTHRADVTTRVGGDGATVVSGVGVDGESDGQGASLVVVHSRPGQRYSGTVVIDDGAIAGITSGRVLRHDFGGFSVPAAPLSAFLHVGVGDGQASFGDGVLSFRGTPISGPDLFAGSDGPLWDDHTLEVPVSLVPGGTSTASNTIVIGGDCLV